jgi:hypothetical protein
MPAWKVLVVGLALVAVAAGCGRIGPGQARLTSGKGAGVPTAEEAGQAVYRYAFSAQALDEGTGQVLPDFSVSLLSEDPAVSALMNSMGDKNGLFHISRNPGLADSAFKALPVLISAVGHKPSLQLLEVGADCVAGQCPGLKPLSLRLPKLDGTNFPSASALAPLAATQLVNASGTAALFKEMIQSGKIDSGMQQLFSGAKNGDVLNNVLVILSQGQGQDPGSLVQSLLSGASGEKLKGLTGVASTLIPLIANTSPDTSKALLAANTLLPYLTPLLNQSGDTGLAGVLKTLLTEGNAQQNLTNLVQAISNKQDKTQALQLAMATFLPMLQGLIAKKQGTTTNPFQSLMLKTFLDPKFFTMIASLGDKSIPKDQKLSTLLTYVQPLLQGLGGKNAPEIGYLFNLLIQDGGLAALKDFPKDATAQEKFAKLIPYIEPIIRGLNGGEGSKLAGLLLPLLSGGNPAAAIKNLIPQDASGSAIASLLPALEPLLKQTMPGKQVFSAQLLQGLVNGDFAALQVTQDLQGAPAVVMSGQARDLFKLINLPNVEKVVALTP